MALLADAGIHVLVVSLVANLSLLGTCEGKHH